MNFSFQHSELLHTSSKEIHTRPAGRPAFIWIEGINALKVLQVTE